ncbi:MAG TPA: thiamine pyrophosphate-dependent dehydrogenase E1 component subunit alpha [Candidatus Nitrosotalea sp.]|nr:thiamine pyrophosphate-dependent dehydrogenase E1 component subunit alpha [Candidatus Nitrosotalea sp.]
MSKDLDLSSAPGSTEPVIPSAMLLEMYRRMLRIRRLDESVKRLVSRGELPGAAHTSIGQEGEVVGACMALEDSDYMTGTHRSHGHPIGKGAPLNALMAELLGKSTGVCKGKGGSMHLADFSRGSLGESGVVGSAIPVATGAALSAKTLGNGRVALCFFGDGASNQGVLYECLNMAAVWSLPIVYLCENNQYASVTAQREVTKELRISKRAPGFGVKGVTVEDGQDVWQVYEVVAEAVARARAGDGPTLVEVMTYRYSDHSEGLRHSGAYRPAEELQAWMDRDPLPIAAARLRSLGVGEAELEGMDEEVRTEVQAALRFAQDSPDPDPEDAFADLFAEPIAIPHRSSN